MSKLNQIFMSLSSLRFLSIEMILFYQISRNFYQNIHKGDFESLLLYQ